MDYVKIYNQLIESAQLKNRKKGKGQYLENHHINPKCLKGTNDKINLVLLTGREHFVADKLLTKIYPDNRKLSLAFHKMAFSKRTIYEMTSRDYQYARELIGNVPLSQETKDKISKSRKGHKHSKETIEKLKIQRFKQLPPNLGMTQSNDWIEKRVSQMRHIKHDEIKQFILSSDFSVKEIAEKYNVSIHTIYKYKKELF